jgi:hypothetical protein
MLALYLTIVGLAPEGSFLKLDFEPMGKVPA